MNVPLDVPLEYTSARCRICKAEDAEWNIYHLCNDGVWRILKEGKSLREYGIDGKENAIFMVHSCCKNIIQQFHTCEDVEEFFMRLRE